MDRASTVRPATCSPTRTGHLLCVDPESGTTVVSTSAGHVTLVPAHAVASIERGAPVDVDPSWMRDDDKPADSIDVARIAERKAQLQQLLIARKIPYSIDEKRSSTPPLQWNVPETFHLLGVASVALPYTSDACLCDNPTVLDKVLQLLRLLDT